MMPQAAVGWWSFHWFRPRLEGPIWKPQCDGRLSSSFRHLGSAVCLSDTAAARGIPHCGCSRSMVQQGSVVLGRCECLASAPFYKRLYCLGGWVVACFFHVVIGVLRCSLRCLRPYTLCRCRKPRLAGGPSTGSDLASRAPYGNRSVMTA